MNQNSLATSACTPSHQEMLQYHNQYTYQQQQQQQRMMMYGAPSPVASPQHTHRQISLEQFQQHQLQQQHHEKLRRASIQNTCQVHVNQSQDESRDAIHSQRRSSANWNNTKSPTSTLAFNLDNSTHSSATSSQQRSPYMSPMLNHIKQELEPSPAQQAMPGPMPPNAVSILAQNHPRSCYQSQEQYSMGQAYPAALFQQQQQRPKLTTTLWEDEGTLCFQVDAKGICVARRQDNNMVNGTKLLNVVGMSRGKRDGILKNEKGRVVVKVGAMHLKGVWITIGRAKILSAQFHILDLLYPLFVDDPNNFLFSPAQHSISSLSSPSINQLLQGGPGITDPRQLSPLHASGITGYALDPRTSIRQPPIPVAAFSANRGLNTGAKSNGRHTSEVDMYLSQEAFPSVGIDYRGIGNSACFPHLNGGYPGSLITASHFPNHSFNGYGPPSNRSTMPRYITAGGDIFSATGSPYTGESYGSENANMQHEQQMLCRQNQSQHQLQENRRILQAMSSEPNGIHASTSPPKSGSTSPKPIPSEAIVNSLAFQTPSNGLYRPYQMLSGIGSGSGTLPSQTPETRKRSHDNGPGASMHTSCFAGNKFPPPVSVSPPATPILRPSEVPDSCSSPCAKSIKAEHSVQALVHSNGLLAQQQFLQTQTNAEENTEEKQSGQAPTISSGNGQCISWTNGQLNDVPSAQGENESFDVEQNLPIQSIPPHLESYRFPQTNDNQSEIQTSPHDPDGDGPLDDSTSTNQPLIQQQEHSPGQLDSKIGPLPSMNTVSEENFLLRSSSDRLIDRHSAVGTLLGIADKMDTDSAFAGDQSKPQLSPTKEIQW